MRKSLSIITCLLLSGKLLAQADGADLQPVNILVDAAATTKTFPSAHFYSVGAGRANEGLRADWQQQLKYIQTHIPFQYIRFHGIFADDMGVYFEDKNGNPLFNFQYIDVLFDFLLSQNIRPFIEFGFMPEALASTPQTIFWWKGNISYPKNEANWQALIKTSVQHWVNRYGLEEVRKWYFEVWNEPNLKDLFFAGTQEDYFKLYALTAKAVKSVDESFKVGGPATAGGEWIPAFITYCKNNAVPLDFVSTHNYGVKSGFLDHLGNHTTVLHSDPLAIAHSVQKNRKEIMASAIPALSLHYTEWSSSYTPTDPFHDSYHSAAYILHQLKAIDTAAMNMSYWTFTDIFEENGPRFTPFHGGFGMLNYQSIPKASFFAYKYLKALGHRQIVTNQPNLLAGKDSTGGINILFWNYTNTHPGDTVSNQAYYKQVLPSAAIAQVQWQVQNLPPGKYELTIRKTGYENNDAYTAYIKLGSPQQLSKQQVAYLKEKTADLPVFSELVQVANDKKYNAALTLHQNEVILIQIKPQTKNNSKKK
jgi:xylan 1,4-beta-xylosidase